MRPFHIDFDKVMAFQKEYVLAEFVIGIFLVLVCFWFRHRKWIGWLWLAAILPYGGYSIYAFLAFFGLSLTSHSEAAALSAVPLIAYSGPPILIFIGLVLAYPRTQPPSNA
jgi:hypothetical protein